MTGKNHDPEKPGPDKADVAKADASKAAPDDRAPAGRRPHAKLPPQEVQAIADKALAAWEGGIELGTVDSAGGVWAFLQMREPSAHLAISRTVAEEAPVTGVVNGPEFGLEPDALKARLASVVLAVATPA